MFNSMTAFGDGRLTAEPELRKTKTGKSVCTFNLAVNHPGPNNAGAVSFVYVETWEKLADRCINLKKGQIVTITGAIRQYSWEGTDGKPVTRMKIVATRVIPGPEAGSKHEEIADADYDPETE